MSMEGDPRTIFIMNRNLIFYTVCIKKIGRALPQAERTGRPDGSGLGKICIMRWPQMLKIQPET